MIYYHLQQKQQKTAHKALNPRNPGANHSYNNIMYISFYALKNNQTKNTNAIYPDFLLQTKCSLQWIQTLLQGS